MAANANLPPLLPVVVDGIPASMLDTPRWAPWRAVWNEKKEKYEKIPYRFDRVTAGLSNKTIKGWGRFDQAMTAYLQNPDKFAGVGYLMTGPHGLVAVDLDHCVDGGEMAPWAAEVVAKLDSYTEVSPSGHGLRVMVAGEVDRDWMNHDVGIEVYAGHAPRFVTITGARLPGSPREVRSARGGAMDALAARYRKVQTAAEVEDLHLPELLGEDKLPEFDELEIPAYARNFLETGPEPGQDRSQALFACSIALNQSGLTRQEVLSILEANEHAMDVAMDHRRQDYDKALRYLWKEHCSAGAARADGLRQLQLDEFEEMAMPDDRRSADAEDRRAPSILDDFDDLGGGEDFSDLVGGAPAPPSKPVKRAKFGVQSLAEFAQARTPGWIIKGVLPRASLAVLFGASASGKSFLVLDMVAAICRGVDWRGARTAKGRAVVICAEGANGFRNRLAAYARHHDIDLADLDLGVIPDAPNFMDKVDVKALALSLKAFGKFDVLVVDTYARVMPGGNENDSKDTGAVVAHCELLHRITGALVLLVHHSGKDATKGARGSGALRAAADCELEVERTNKYRAVTVTKMKDGEDGTEYRFRLNDVVLGWDDDGDDITSCVVEHIAPEENQVETLAKPLGPVQQRIMDALGQYLAGEVERGKLVQDVQDATPHDASGKPDRNLKMKIGRSLDKMISDGLLAEISGLIVLCK